VKTVAIKVEDDLHAQLLLVAQLQATTLTDVIRQAVETHVSQLIEGEELAAKAETLMAELDQEMAIRKQALGKLLSDLGDRTGTSSGGTKRARRSPAST
jgi:hypothetical protein